jgi:hypothetical protein
MSFSPLNIYTFAAARGQFLRPDVQALLKNASVGLYSDFANSHYLILRREAEAVRERLDASSLASVARLPAIWLPVQRGSYGGTGSFPQRCKPPSCHSHLLGTIDVASAGVRPFEPAKTNENSIPVRRTARGVQHVG